MPWRPKTHEQLAREAHPELYPSRHVVDHERRKSDAVQAEADRLRSSGRWKRFRSWFLSRHPLCAACLAQGHTRAASEVDHVEPIRALIARGTPEQAFAEGACEALCSSCHAAKSARERRAGADFSARGGG